MPAPVNLLPAFPCQKVLSWQHLLVILLHQAELSIHHLCWLGALRVAQDAQLGHLDTVGLFTVKYSKLKFSVAPRVSDPLQEGYNGLVGLQ